MVQQLALMPHSKKGFDSQAGWGLACSPRVCIGLLQVFQFPLPLNLCTIGSPLESHDKEIVNLSGTFLVKLSLKELQKATFEDSIKEEFILKRQ